MTDSNRARWRQDQLLACIRQYPGMSVSGYMRILKINPAFVNTMRNDLNRLVKREKVRKVKTNESRHVFFWPTPDSTIVDLDRLWNMPTADKENR